MSILSDLNPADRTKLGKEMYDFAAEIFPICRSITGNGTRETLRRIKAHIPLQTVDVPSGEEVFDWVVPKEWNIRDAYIADSNGNRLVDFRKSNLHVVNYSAPVHENMLLTVLRSHLFTLPEQPDLIPYRTSYYKEDWGFCLSHRQLLALDEGQYEVCIDSTLGDGHLTYGECYLCGHSADEVLISSHVCHPSLANDNLSGLIVGMFLARLLLGRKLRYSYRFLFVPGTIGSITWLARNPEAASRVRHGLVLTCLGDAGGFHYKKSRRGNAEIDQAAAHVLSHSREKAEILEFSPYGYDERQYCSPGFNLPVGCLMRSVWGAFPEYHTSADNLNFIYPSRLADSLVACAGILDVLENNRTYRNEYPYCEPQLGRRGLYPSMGGETGKAETMARLWVLNLSDGEHSLLDVAERSGMPFSAVYEAADLLCEHGLLSVMPKDHCEQAARQKVSHAKN